MRGQKCGDRRKIRSTEMLPNANAADESTPFMARAAKPAMTILAADGAAVHHCRNDREREET
jgi:hypothetical protein